MYINTHTATHKRLRHIACAGTLSATYTTSCTSAPTSPVWPSTSLPRHQAPKSPLVCVSTTKHRSSQAHGMPTAW